MALIITKTYVLSAGETPETYDVTYWRVVESHIDVDQKKSIVKLKGYKSKVHRNANGIESFFKQVTVRGAWVYTAQNINDFNALELAYMSVKQSQISEGFDVNWANAQDDVGN
jgi:hypothetical protein